MTAQGERSGAGSVVGSTGKLLIVSGLSGGTGQSRSGVSVKVNLLVQNAVFVTNHETSFGIILGDQKPQCLRIIGDIENKIRCVRFAGTQRLRERRGWSVDLGKCYLALG